MERIFDKTLTHDPYLFPLELYGLHRRLFCDG